jgi:hypothetical protein
MAANQHALTIRRFVSEAIAATFSKLELEDGKLHVRRRREPLRDDVGAGKGGENTFG